MHIVQLAQPSSRLNAAVGADPPATRIRRRAGQRVQPRAVGPQPSQGGREAGGGAGDGDVPAAKVAACEGADEAEVAGPAARGRWSVGRR